MQVKFQGVKIESLRATYLKRRRQNVSLRGPARRATRRHAAARRGDERGPNDALNRQGNMNRD